MAENPGDAETHPEASGEEFILVMDDALDAATCAGIVSRFVANGTAVPGRVGGGLMPELKDSHDLCLSGDPAWRDVELTLNSAVMRGLLRYVRRYPHAVIAPLMLRASDNDTRLTADVIAAMPDAALTPILEHVFRPGTINIQHYAADRGGYPYWHCELYPLDASADTLHRWLLWTLYLNEGFGEGETEFLYQRRRVAPRTGSLLIAPTAFTHTHRGNRPLGADKYIATSWILFQRAEHLFPATRG